MGLFNFIKESGENLWGKLTNSKMEQRIDVMKDYLKKLNLPGAENVNVALSEDGSTATISGNNITPEVKDKILVAVGNIAGISHVKDNITLAATTSSHVVHDHYTVKAGDTLSSIAKAHYGDTKHYMKIFEANQPMLSNPDKIYPGQTLLIPKL